MSFPVGLLQAPGFLDAVQAKGERLRKGLRNSLAGNSHVVDVSRSA